MALSGSCLQVMTNTNNIFCQYSRWAVRVANQEIPNKSL